MLSRNSKHCFSPRSEEHTSELKSPCNFVCRLLLEKRKKGVGNILKAYLHHDDHIGTQMAGEELQKLCHGQISEDEYWKSMISKNNLQSFFKLLKNIIRKTFYPIPGS